MFSLLFYLWLASQPAAAPPATAPYNPPTIPQAGPQIAVSSPAPPPAPVAIPPTTCPKSLQAPPPLICFSSETLNTDFCHLCNPLVLYLEIPR